MRSGYWQDLTTTDFGRVDPERTVALLPVAAVEQHGPHLPLSTDALINDGIVRAALERLPADITLLVLPAQNVGLSPEHTSFAGTLSIRDSPLLDVVDRHRPQRRAHGLAQADRASTRTAARRALVDLVGRAVALRARHARRARHVLRVRRAARAVRSRRGRARHPRRRSRDVVAAAPAAGSRAHGGARRFQGLAARARGAQQAARRREARRHRLARRGSPSRRRVRQRRARRRPARRAAPVVLGRSARRRSSPRSRRRR